MDISKEMAVIISFQPEPEKIIRNVNCIAEQVGHVILIDNGSDNVELWEGDLKGLKNLKIVRNKKNIGLPINYNRAAKYAYKHCYEWLIIFDQDTLIPRDFRDRLLDYEPESDVAIVCPLFRDINLYSVSQFNRIIPKEDFSSIDKCISSGSINRTSTLIELGGFDNKLFIDMVDYDYCKRVKLNNYKIIQDNRIIIDHSIGNSQWITLFGKRYFIHNHGAFRKYYIIRNNIYYARKYHLSIFNDKIFYRSLIKKYILVLFERDNKISKIKAVLKGTLDGLFMKI